MQVNYQAKKKRKWKQPVRTYREGSIAQTHDTCQHSITHHPSHVHSHLREFRALFFFSVLYVVFFYFLHFPKQVKREREMEFLAHRFAFAYQIVFLRRSCLFAFADKLHCSVPILSCALPCPPPPLLRVRTFSLYSVLHLSLSYTPSLAPPLRRKKDMWCFGFSFSSCSSLCGVSRDAGLCRCTVLKRQRRRRRGRERAKAKRGGERDGDMA